MALNVSDRGLATAYVTLPLQKFDTERHVVQRAYVDWLESARDRHAAVSPPEFVYLLGQADMAVQFAIHDFRRLFDIRYPYPASVSRTVNWLYSVPYTISAPPPPEGSVYRFLLHLRLRREVYAYPGMEETLVRHFHRVLESAGVAAEFHASLGWSDLFINGYFAEDAFPSFVKALTEIHEGSITAGAERLPVSSRMLTLLGYPWPVAPQVAYERHVTLLRGTPGSLQLLKKPLAGLGTAYLMAGKTDFLVFPDEQIGNDVLERQQSFAERDDGAQQIQKIETHIVLTPMAVVGFEAEPVAVFDQQKHVRRCLCSADDAELRNTIDAYLHLLPYELRQAVQNTLLLLAGMMTDGTVCCDVRHAVFACESALLSLVQRLAAVTARVVTVPAAATEKLEAPDFDAAARRREERFAARRDQQQAIYRIYRAVTEWHVYTERVLRQRSVGSFEEMLGQTDRAITYNGGVQKFLFLADSLIADFVKRIDRTPARRPRFATLYDSLKTILSFRDAATVRIPVRKIFQLPLAVADMWHEVGVYLFFLRYDYQQSDQQSHAHFSELADIYGDLVVYLYGFHGDWNRALNSLISGWIDVFGDEHYAEVRSMSFFDVIWRAFLLSEFDAIRSGVVSVDRGDFVDNAIARVMGFLEKPRFERWRSTLRMTVEEWRHLKQMALGPDIEQIHDLYAELCWTQTRQPATQLEFTDASIRSLDSNDDLNDAFAGVADWLKSEHPPDASTAFRAMAALGKNAAIEYHRRQISIGEDKSRLRSAVRVR